MYGHVWVGYGGLMNEIDEFEALGRVTVDGRRRVPLGQAAASPKARYTVFVGSGGEILLRPVRSGSAAEKASAATARAREPQPDEHAITARVSRDG